jgi:RimJ/RimL family protein N-acetyltransferase
MNARAMDRPAVMSNAPSRLQPSGRRMHDLHFRPLRPGDWRRLRRFHRRLSSTTVQLRFHGAKRELSVPLAHYFTDIDGKDRAAIVATTGTRGRIVGVARYARVDETRAEVAFVVEDEYQGRKVGGRLMKRIKALALQNGITEFVADVLPENAPMMRLLREAGPTTTRFSHGECVVHVDLSAPG